MEGTGEISLMAGLAMLALMVLGATARMVVTESLAGFGVVLVSGFETAKFTHLAVGLLLCGVVSLLAR